MNFNPHTNTHTQTHTQSTYRYFHFHTGTTKFFTCFFFVVCRSINMKLENVISTYPSAIHKSTFSHILPRACFILNHGHPHPVIFKRRSGLLNKLKRTNFDLFFYNKQLKVWIYFPPTLVRNFSCPTFYAPPNPITPNCFFFIPTKGLAFVRQIYVLMLFIILSYKEVSRWNGNNKELKKIDKSFSVFKTVSC